ncbi:PLP-dependent aminotransferase family protein [Pseudomonas cavernicola]|uniref:PLP-dependent aminotransferase family protein n=1 Tax=Pseudomonas cavernicola TaxID=2320866 RepID=A0A418XMB3_9PSED|nr:PLP-dependent aminotransferase family protein [Pseudomonas cavernicola]RJG13576.1 PLP-dependent aminotransferase family protein [Pseudomonas cavernicola]
MLFLDPCSDAPLVSQIVNSIQQAIDEQRLRPGAKLPSIRKFAQTHHVSHFTVVEAYDRLVALGYLVPVRNAGFYVRGQAGDTHTDEPSTATEQGDSEFDFDAYLLLQKVFQPLDVEIRPGVGLLPLEWTNQEGLQRSLRALARVEPSSFSSYGHTKGDVRLRGKLADKLTDYNITSCPEQILLTNGASQALDLVSRYLVQRGDTVLVDEPGYHNLFLNLRLQGAKLVGVPRTVAGLDVTALESAVRTHRPKVFFTNTRLQSPTGTSLPLAVVHRLLQLAEKYDFLIVENDIYADLDPNEQQVLAGMDQLARVIYIGSFSKVIAPALRVGFIAAHRDLIDELAPLKMISGLTSSEITEALVFDVLLQGRHRKHVKQLRETLAVAHEVVARRLASAGMSIFVEPRAGLFLWARHLLTDDAAALAIRAKGKKILLAPGQLFMPDARAVPWIRFNVAHSLDDRLYAFLEGQQAVMECAAVTRGT